MLVAPQHDENATKQDGMVYELWNDGEVILTKSGSLYRQRNLHQDYPSFQQCDVCLGLGEIEKPYYVVCASQEREGVYEARKWLVEQYGMVAEPKNLQFDEHNKHVEDFCKKAGLK